MAMYRILSRWLSSARRRSSQASTTQCRLALEGLEDRAVPAVFSPVPPAVPATAPLSADPATAYVQILYLDLLGRNATAPETSQRAHVVKDFGPPHAVR